MQRKKDAISSQLFLRLENNKTNRSDHNESLYFGFLKNHLPSGTMGFLSTTDIDIIYFNEINKNMCITNKAIL